MQDGLVKTIGKHLNPYYDMQFLDMGTDYGKELLTTFDVLQHNFWSMATVFIKPLPRGAVYGAIGGALAGAVADADVGAYAISGAFFGSQVDFYQYLIRWAFKYMKGRASFFAGDDERND